MSNTRVSRRLDSFYEELTSVDAILRALARDRPEAGTVTAADLYTRSLDCQNQGGFALLERHAALVTEYSALGEGQRVLDAGCGLGGPGRYLADRFGCAVTGIDVLQARVQAAATLTRMVGLGRPSSVLPGRRHAPPLRCAPVRAGVDAGCEHPYRQQGGAVRGAGTSGAR